MAFTHMVSAFRNKKPKKKVTLQSVQGQGLHAEVTDIFQHNWLVESPRQILRERTRVSQDTPLTSALEGYYTDIAHVEEESMETMINNVKELVKYMMPRLKKYGKHFGFRFTDVIYAGSVFDNTQVITPYEADIFILFDNHRCKVESLEAGYKFIPLCHHQIVKYSNKKDTKCKRKAKDPVECEKLDEFRFGRSEDETYLSSMVVAWRMHAFIEKALRYNQAADVEIFQVEDGRAFTVITYKGLYKINVSAATYVTSEDVHLVARPYVMDENPGSDMLWRTSHVLQERIILERMEHADRGVRRKAFKILKALVQTEHTLQGLTSYQIKTVLLHCFEKDVDSVRRWQRPDLARCFASLLEQLSEFLTAKNLPNFFEKDFNLLKNMDSRKLMSLQYRVTFLANNEKELVRILNKRQHFLRLDENGKPRPITL